MSSKKSSSALAASEPLHPMASDPKPTFTQAVRTRYRLSKLSSVVQKLSYRELARGNKKRAEQLLRVRYVLHKRLKSMEATIRSLWNQPERRTHA
jgi:hypothetical protein